MENKKYLGRTLNKHYAYMLRCSDGSIYSGYAVDPYKREKVHNTGKGAKYTRTRLPVKLVYFEEFDSKVDAMKREYAFKQYTHAEKEKIIKNKGENQMKVLVVSDIHGSSYYAEKIKEIVEKEEPEKIVLLGDLYYHGPRNDLTQEYNPMKVAEVLNSLKDKLLVVKGNCDAEVDEMISEFKFEDHILTNINGKNIYFTHGHKYNIEVIPYEDFDILIYGHIHQGFIEEKEGYLFANPGSISLPKGGTEHSYLVIDDKELILKNVEGKVIQTYKL